MSCEKGDKCKCRTEIRPKATAALQDELVQELNVADPDPETARAILEGKHEDSSTNKPRGESGGS